MKKLNVAIVGCGRISTVYIEAFKEYNDIVEPVCAVDKLVDRAKKFAENFQTCSYLDNIEDMWAMDIDVLHICLPHHLHAKVAIEAMKRGIHVLTEKPVAMDGLEADEMIACQKESHVLAACIFQTRYVEAVTRIKQAISEGRLGKILGAKSILTWSRQEDYYKGSDWKGTWHGEGGGVLIDQAIHSIDRIRYILDDEVEWVDGKISTYNHSYLKVEDTANACVKFKGGTLYNLYATNVYYANSPVELEFIGEKGRAGLIQDFGYIEIGDEREEIRDTYEGHTVGKNYWGSTHNLQVKEFYDAVIARRDKGKIGHIGVDLEDGKKTLEIVRAIYMSSIKGKRIFFPYQEEKIKF